MPRPPRVDFEGAWHHVMNRGARRKPIFEPTDHAGLFTGLVEQTVERFSVEVHAYAVMPNHYHLLMCSPRANLSAAMGWLGSRFTRQVNENNRWDGPVFRGRFTSQLLETASRVLTVAAYIHLNPVRARLVRRMDAHCWTSHRSYLGLDVPPQWLRRDLVLAEAGGPEGFARFVTHLRTNRQSWPDGFDAETGWFVDVDPPPEADRPDVSDGAPTGSAAAAEEVLNRVCALCEVTRSSLRRAKRGRGGNAARRFAVWALTRETALTHREIGRALDMTASQVAVTLVRLRKDRTTTSREWMDTWAERGRSKSTN